MIEIYNQNNLNLPDLLEMRRANLIYCDYMYANKDFTWVDLYWFKLVENGVFICQTDNSTIAEIKLKLDSMPNSHFIGIAIYKQDWGGRPKKGFPQKHDYILMYTNGINYKWYPERIQIPKQMIDKKFNPSGKITKTPCSVWDDLGNFATTSKERVKNKDGKNVRYQKPLKMLNRLFLPFTDVGDLIIDPFMGVASAGLWCKQNKRDYIGIEMNYTIFNLAKERLEL